MKSPDTGKHAEPRIFISYAREDVAHARALATALERQRWAVWWDAGILVGTDFRQSIESALKAAQCVVVLWSANSIGSRWVFDEAQSGLERNILLPVLIEDVSPPLGFRTLQAARLWEWDGNEDDPELRTLIDRIESVLETGTAGGVHAPGPASPISAGERAGLLATPAHAPRSAPPERASRATRAAPSRRWRAGLVAVTLLALSVVVGVYAASRWGAPEKYIWQSRPYDVTLNDGAQGLHIRVVNLSGRQIEEPLTWWYRRKRSAPGYCNGLDSIGPSIPQTEWQSVAFEPLESDPDAGILAIQQFPGGAEERFGVRAHGAKASECLVIAPYELHGVHLESGPVALARLKANPFALAFTTALTTFVVLASAVLISFSLLTYLLREKRT